MALSVGFVFESSHHVVNAVCVPSRCGLEAKTEMKQKKKTKRQPKPMMNRKRKRKKRRQKGKDIRSFTLGLEGTKLKTFLALALNVGFVFAVKGDSQPWPPPPKNK